jgi:hypothetical protein
MVRANGPPGLYGLRRRMLRLTYALQFHRPPKGMGGTESPTTASGLELRTQIADGSLESALLPLAGDEAVLELDYTLNHDGTLFFESGVVTFGGPGASSLTFASVGAGSLLGEPDSDGFSHGVVAWAIESGTGAFAGAGGAISSNFLVNLQTDELIDTHLGVVRLPEVAAR